MNIRLIMLNIFLCLLLMNNALAKDFQAQVIKVVDGDTVHVMYNQEKIKIRLYGIDAPEMNQAYAQESKAFLNALIADKFIRVSPLNKDRYGRLVAMLHYENKDIQALLIENGLAWVYPKYCKKPICDTWKELERNARAKTIALWERENPQAYKNYIPPWEWRK